jgi:WD40 repeat protein
VFISHTSDLAEYPSGLSFVRAAVDAVLKAGLRPVDMAQFAAREGTPAAYCERRVCECDIYLAVVGFRYGSLVPDRADGVSYTELEFRTATRVGVPRLVFLLDERVEVPSSLADPDRNAIDGFRGRLLSAGLIVKTFSSPVELGEAVLHALYEQLLALVGRGGGAADSEGRHGRANGGAGGRRPWMAPPLERIVERPELADPILVALSAPGRSEVGLTTALQGAGGFGKTTLAAWVCHRMEIDRRYPGGLLWVTLGQEVHGADLAERVNDLAFALSGTRPAISDPDAAGAELGRLLDEREPVLLVVDDVWEHAQLRPFRFGGRACTRLVTTRIPDLLPADGTRILVDAMSAGQARELIASGVGGLPAGVTDRLATVAGRWPVLLNLVNGVLRRRVARGQPPQQAALEIERLLTAHGPSALDPARPNDRSQAVAATVDASLTLLDPDDRHRYLDLAIFPEDVDIPMDVLTLLWPDCRADAVGEEFARLGLVADVRLDPPGPRLVVHDVLRAYLRSRRNAEDRATVHRRLVDAATGLLPAGGNDDGSPRPWWRLPGDAGYLWRFLPHHLQQARRSEELAALVCDLRWVEAKTRRFGSAVGAEADLALVPTTTAVALGRTLRHNAHLLGPISPPEALGATLASRLHGVPEVERLLDSYRATLPRPRLEPAWPLPDQTQPGQPSAAVGHTGSGTGCAFSPDGSLLVTVSDDGTARLWRTAAGTQQGVLSGHTGGVWDCAFSPDSTLLATVSDDRTARLWRIEDGTSMALTGHTDWVTACAFSPDGALLATTSNDQTARLWQTADGTLLAELTGHTGGVWDCAFSPDGTRLATASRDHTVRLWRTADGALLMELTGHSADVLGCAFSPDGALLATVGEGGEVRMWHLPDGTLKTTLTGHTERVMRCAFSPNGTLLATTADDGTARLWHMPNGASYLVLNAGGTWVRGCAFSPDGTLLATTSDHHAGRLWRVHDGAPQTVLGDPSYNVTSSAFSRDGTLLATACAGTEHATGSGTVQLWKLPETGEPTVLTWHANVAGRCAFSPDGMLLATGTLNGAVQLWRMPDATEQAALAGHTQRIRHCAFSLDGTLLATASNDRTVRLWQMPDGIEKNTIGGYTGRVATCAFSPDGTLLAAAGSGGMLQLHQIPDGSLKMTLTGHTDWVNGCAFSPDGTLLATASDDRTVRLWELPDGTLKAVLTGHLSWVEGCAFSPDGTLLATTSRDGTVRLWNTTTYTCHCALRVAGPLLGIAWHPTGTPLCATGGAGTYMLTYLP